MLTGAGIKSEVDVGMKLTILRLMRMLSWGMAIQEVQKMNITNQLNNERAAKLAAKAEDVSGCVHYLPCFLLPPKLV